MQAEINKVSVDHAAVTYCVAGYIGRCISRKRKYDSCRSSLIETEHLPCLGDASDVENASQALADRGGLSAPKQYCLALCTLGVQMDSKISGNDRDLQQFFYLKNQRAAFVAILTEIVKEDVDHKFMLKQICAEGHYNINLITQSFFNCFAKTN